MGRAEEFYYRGVGNFDDEENHSVVIQAPADLRESSLIPRKRCDDGSNYSSQDNANKHGEILLEKAISERLTHSLSGLHSTGALDLLERENKNQLEDEELHSLMIPEFATSPLVYAEPFDCCESDELKSFAEELVDDVVSSDGLATRTNFHIDVHANNGSVKRKRRKRADWSEPEVHELWLGIAKYGNNWTAIRKFCPKKSYSQIKDKGRRILSVLGWKTARGKFNCVRSCNQAMQIAKSVLNTT